MRTSGKFTDGVKNTVDIFMWLRIFASPFLIGLFLATLAFLTLSGPFGLTAAAVTVVLGTGIGVWFAEKMRRKHGAVEFMARVNASPELNKPPRND